MTSAKPQKHNRLKQLRAFCHAAQTGSISKAATRLHLSQPSISLHIQTLEKELDTPLFERRGPKIRLTPAGTALLELALPLVDGMDGLPDLFAARLGKVNRGYLDIAAGESTILYLLPEFIERFKAAYPQITLRLHNVTGRDGMTMLRADEVDFAVGSLIEIEDDLSYQPIFTYDPMLIMPIGHPLSQLENLTLADISPYGLILPPKHLSTWRIIDLVFQQNNVPYSVTLEAGGWEVIKRYVAIGMGISIVTSICLGEQEPLERRPLGRYFPQRSYGVVTRHGKFLSPQAKSFLNIMHADFFAQSVDDSLNRIKSSHWVLPKTRTDIAETNDQDQALS